MQTSTKTDGFKFSIQSELLRAQQLLPILHLSLWGPCFAAQSEPCDCGDMCQAPTQRQLCPPSVVMVGVNGVLNFNFVFKQNS